MLNFGICKKKKNFINPLTKGQINLSDIDSEKPQNSPITPFLNNIYLKS